MNETKENVFEYILRQEKEFQTGYGVPVIDGWDFKMYQHIRLSVLYKYGQLDTGKTDDKPVENIILPILNVAYRLEDIDVKDIEPYVDDKDNYYKSFLVKKFHKRWVRKFEIDTFIDQVKTSWIDFGLGLVKNKGKNPEFVPLQRLAFCDQTDVLAGPICEKHSYSPDQLLEMKGKWDADAIDEVITMSRAEKSQQQVQGQKAKTPGHYIEVYELHGMFPEDWNPKQEDADPNKYTRQIQIITYYQSKDDKNNKKGIALYQGLEKELIYDAIKRDEIYGRACGYGGAEELFEPQVWNTYSRIQMKEMLDVAAAIIIKTTDSGLARRQRITDLQKGEMLEIEEGKDASQLVIQPINWQVFDKWQNDMKVSAQTIGSANDPQLGVEPKAGTAWRLQQLTTIQGQGIHQYRRGLFATFLERLYRNWFLKYLVNEMNKGDEWVEELSLDELKWVAEQVSVNESEKRKKRLILQGKVPAQIEIDEFREKFKEQWMSSGNKKFIKTLKNDFKDIPLDVYVNIAGKQKNLVGEVDKIMTFIKMIVSTGGAILQTPGMAELLNQVIEYIGLDPVDFSKITSRPRTQQTPPTAPASIQPMPMNPQMAPIG